MGVVLSLFIFCCSIGVSFLYWSFISLLEFHFSIGVSFSSGLQLAFCLVELL